MRLVPRAAHCSDHAVPLGGIDRPSTWPHDIQDMITEQRDPIDVVRLSSCNKEMKRAHDRYASHHQNNDIEAKDCTTVPDVLVDELD